MACGLGLSCAILYTFPRMLCCRNFETMAFFQEWKSVQMHLHCVLILDIGEWTVIHLKEKLKYSMCDIRIGISHEHDPSPTRCHTILSEIILSLRHSGNKLTLIHLQLTGSYVIR